MGIRCWAFGNTCGSGAWCHSLTDRPARPSPCLVQVVLVVRYPVEVDAVARQEGSAAHHDPDVTPQFLYFVMHGAPRLFCLGDLLLKLLDGLLAI